MQRSFLDNLGLSKEVIDQVMDEHGKDIENIKGERDTAQAQLKTAQDTLKSFEGVNVAELQGKIAKLTQDMEADKAAFQKQIADRDFDDLLKATAASFNPRDIKAVMPFLDVEKLKESKNQEADIKSALEAVKKENAYLFQDVNIPYVVSSTPGQSKNNDDLKTQANEALRSLLGRD